MDPHPEDLTTLGREEPVWRVFRVSPGERAAVVECFPLIGGDSERRTAPVPTVWRGDASRGDDATVSVVTVLGGAAVVLTSAGWVPQVRRAITTRSVHDFSRSYLLLLGAGVSCWLVYGLIRTDAALVVANAIAFASLGVLFLIQRCNPASDRRPRASLMSAANTGAKRGIGSALSGLLERARVPAKGVSPAECHRCNNYAKARRLIEHEDGLINHRLTWLVFGETLLFAASGVLLNLEHPSGSKSLAEKLGPTLEVVVAALGFSVAMFALAGVLGAFSAMHQVHQRWWELTSGDPENSRHRCGNDNSLERLQGRGSSLLNGAIPAFGLPVSFAFGWIAFGVVRLAQECQWSWLTSVPMGLILGCLWIIILFIFAKQSAKLGELARHGCTKASWWRPFLAWRSLKNHRRLEQQFVELRLARLPSANPSNEEHKRCTRVAFLLSPHRHAARRALGADLHPRFCPYHVDGVLVDCCSNVRSFREYVDGHREVPRPTWLHNCLMRDEYWSA